MVQPVLGWCAPAVKPYCVALRPWHLNAPLQLPFPRCDPTYVQKLTQVLVQSTSCPTGLLDIFIYFIFNMILCVLVEIY